MIKKKSNLKNIQRRKDPNCLEKNAIDMARYCRGCGSQFVEGFRMADARRAGGAVREEIRCR